MLAATRCDWLDTVSLVAFSRFARAFEVYIADVVTSRNAVERGDWCSSWSSTEHISQGKGSFRSPYFDTPNISLPFSLKKIICHSFSADYQPLVFFSHSFLIYYACPCDWSYWYDTSPFPLSPWKNSSKLTTTI